MVNIRKERWWIYGKSSTEEFETSELIPLRLLEHKPFYIEHEGDLIIRDIEVPVDESIITDIGELPSGKERLKEDPEAYAVAIWMVGYFGSYRTIKPITDKMISSTLRVDKLAVTKARKALDSKYLTISHVVEKVKVGKKKEPLSVGFKYVAKIALKNFHYRVVDSPLRIAISPSKPLTEVEVGVKKRSKLVTKLCRPIENMGLSIEDRMKRNGCPSFGVDVPIKVDMNCSLIKELDLFRVTTAQTLSHGNQKEIKRDILHFVNLLQSFHQVDPTDHNMFYDKWVSGDDTNYFCMSYELLRKVFGDGQSLRSPKAVMRVLDTLENGLCWIEAKRNSRGNKHYQEGKFPAMYRFTSKFVEMNGGEVREFITTKTLETFHEVLSVTTIDSRALQVFDKIAEARKWDTNTKKIQLLKIKHFGLHITKFKEPRIASRVYTSVAYLPREFRKFVRINGCRTSEIDLKTAHPFLIAHFFTDFKKKEAWLKYLKHSDVYLDLIDKVPIPKKIKDTIEPDQLRKHFKNLMNAYMNGGGINAFDSILELDVDFGEYVANIFPDLDEIVQFLINTRSEEGENNGTAIELQELESKIIGTHFMCHSEYQCISLHDGLLCKIQDLDKLIKDVELRC